MLGIRSLPTERVRKILPLVALAFTVIAVFLVRFTLLNKYESPPGSDVANHLTVLHAYQGNDVTGLAPHERYPPIYFFLILSPLLQIFPTFTALKISMALTSTIIAVPFFFIAKSMLRNEPLSLLLTFLFAFAEGYSDMIGWGGIPNFLGIFFMLISVYYFLRMVENDSSRDAIVSGVFLGLLFGTHHLTALYYSIVLVATLLLLFLLSRSSIVSARRPLAVFSATGALSLIPFSPIYLTIFSQRAYSSIQTNPWRIHELFANIPSGVYLFFREILFIWIVTAIIGFILLWRDRQDEKTLFPVLTSSFVIAVFILLLVIPEHPTRPLYFLYVPLLLVFGFCICKLQKYVGPTKSTRAHMKSLKHASATLLVLVTASFLITASYFRLAKAIDYYHTLDEEIVTVLDWIKENTPKEAVVALSEKSWGWWMEGYCERKAFIAADSKLFMYEQQRMQVDIANRIFSGFHVFENGYLRVSDNFPLNLGNPAVSVSLGTLYQELFFIDEADSAEFSYSPIDDPANEHEISLMAIENKTINVESEDGCSCVGYTYSWIDGSILRSTRLDGSGSCVDINYTMSTTGLFYKRANITVVISPHVNVIDHTIVGGIVNLVLGNSLGDIFNVQVRFAEPSLVNVDFLEEHPKHLSPALLFRTLPTREDLRIRLEMQIEPGINHATDETSYFNAYELIESNGIDFILMKEGTLRDSEKFYLDMEHFTPVDVGTQEVLLFRWNG